MLFKFAFQTHYPKPETVYWSVNPIVLSYEDIVQLAGEKLADFCVDHETYVLVPKSQPFVSKQTDMSGRCFYNFTLYSILPLLETLIVGTLCG